MSVTARPERLKLRELEATLHGTLSSFETNLMLQILTLRLEEAKNKLLTVTPERFLACQAEAQLLQDLIKSITTPRNREN